MMRLLRALAALVLLAGPLPAWAQAPAAAASEASPLVIGETFTIASKVLGETRRINVYTPAVYADSPQVRLPVLYMPDGGLGEDFLHIAGLVQISTQNGTMRPFILVGIENTQRRRDLTGPTSNAEDRKIAPVVGGSAAFRRFIRTELMPTIRARYRTTDETAIVGESLAGLFVVETFFLEPDLFDEYVAVDPSLWWNDKALLKEAAERLRAHPPGAKTIFVAASSDDVDGDAKRLAAALADVASAGFRWRYADMPHETHGTIFHPAALRAFRWAFAPKPAR